MTGFPGVGGQFGAYRIIGILGRGGMGIVYHAVQSPLNRPVALKVLDPRLADDPAFVARFGREAAVLAAMDSPHIIRIFDHGQIDGCLYLATQYVAGGDLSDYVHRTGPLEPGVALDLTAQIAAALVDAHTQGVVHRDVKPSNVLLHTSAGAPFAYLGDFGIAQSNDAGTTQTGLVAGSWAYLAPERHHGGTASPQSDLYSVGCVLWILLTGANPYAGTDVQMAMAHVSAPIPQLQGGGDTTAALNHILQRCLAKSPADRYPSAQALVADLRAAQAGLQAVRSGATPHAGLDVDDDRTRLRVPLAGTENRPSAVPALSPPRAPLRTGLLLTGGAALVVIALIAAVLAWWPRTAPMAATGVPAESAGAATSAPPTVAEPTTSFVCWNGDRAADLLDCTDPRDAGGVKYLYPSMQDMSGNCARRELKTIDGVVYECFFDQDELIRYRWYQDDDVARSHYEESYADVTPRAFVVDGEDVGTLYDRHALEKGVYRMSVLWHRDHFAFSVEARTRERQLELLDLVRVRAVADFRGYPQGSRPRDGVIG